MHSWLSSLSSSWSWLSRRAHARCHAKHSSVNTSTFEREREGRGEGCVRGTRETRERRVVALIHISSQRRVGVTLFRESADRIALIARRVKLPRSPLIERSARVPAYVGTENCVYIRVRCLQLAWRHRGLRDGLN